VEAFLKNNDINIFLNSSNSSIQIIFSITENYEPDSMFSKSIAEIAEFNEKTKGLVGGVYVPFTSDSEYYAEAGVQIARKLRIPLGKSFKDCAKFGVHHHFQAFYKEMKFITCGLKIKLYEDEPEAAAEKAMALAYEVKKRARLADIKAEISTVIFFVSDSRRTFQRFWCHIVEITIRKKHYPRVLMFDSFGELINVNYSSWWKVSRNSDEKALIETFDYMPREDEIEECSKICDTCDRLLDCCSGFCKPIYFMDQEFKVCVPINHTNECLAFSNTTNQELNKNVDVYNIISNNTWIAISTVLLLALLIGAILSAHLIQVSNKYFASFII